MVRQRWSNVQLPSHAERALSCSAMRLRKTAVGADMNRLTATRFDFTFFGLLIRPIDAAYQPFTE